MKSLKTFEEAEEVFEEADLPDIRFDPRIPAFVAIVFEEAEEAEGIDLFPEMHTARRTGEARQFRRGGRYPVADAASVGASLPLAGTARLFEASMVNAPPQLARHPTATIN